MTKFAHMAVRVVLDRSGSMANGWALTLSKLNEYFSGLKLSDVETTVSVDAFDGTFGVVTLRESVPAKDLQPITAKELPTAGATPLYDAIAAGITKLNRRPPQTNEGVTLVILTDGEENASVEFPIRAGGREKIKQLIAEHEAKGWLVIFLGEGLEVAGQSVGLGIRGAGAMAYDRDAIGATMQSVSRMTETYAKSGDATLAAFTDEERKASLTKE
jgi:hypothetical protein